MLGLSVITCKSNSEPLLSRPRDGPESRTCTNIPPRRLQVLLLFMLTSQTHTELMDIMIQIS